MFAHRYITRSAAEGGANQVELSEAEFALRKRLGLFVMDWEMSGHRYGIGTELNYWLAAGLSVVVNGSHAHLEHALKAYPEMTVIWVTEEPEDAAPEHPTAPPIATRPGCRALTSPRTPGCRMVHISGNGSLQLAGEKLVSVLRGYDE
jgi:ribose 1,5-bisphosphokinase